MGPDQPLVPSIVEVGTAGLVRQYLLLAFKEVDGGSTSDQNLSFMSLLDSYELSEQSTGNRFRKETNDFRVTSEIVVSLASPGFNSRPGGRRSSSTIRCRHPAADPSQGNPCRDPPQSPSRRLGVVAKVWQPRCSCVASEGCAPTFQSGDAHGRGKHWAAGFPF